MGTVFLILYFVILFVQVVFLIRNIKKPLEARWKPLYLMELVPLVAAAAVAFYYNSLPDSGFLGMTYLAEILFSMAASCLYGIMLVVSLCIALIFKLKNKT